MMRDSYLMTLTMALGFNGLDALMNVLQSANLSYY